jgi:hypothetical protein
MGRTVFGAAGAAAVLVCGAGALAQGVEVRFEALAPGGVVPLSQEVEWRVRVEITEPSLFGSDPFIAGWELAFPGDGLFSSVPGSIDDPTPLVSGDPAGGFEYSSSASSAFSLQAEDGDVSGADMTGLTASADLFATPVDTGTFLEFGSFRATRSSAAAWSYDFVGQIVIGESPVAFPGTTFVRPAVFSDVIVVPSPGAGALALVALGVFGRRRR